MIMIINDIHITVKRKAIKNMYIRVKQPGPHIEVSSPYGLSNDDIKNFVMTKMSWIEKQSQKIAAKTVQKEQGFIAGEKIFIWGTEYTLNVNYGNKYSLMLCENEAMLTVRPNCDSSHRLKYINEWYRSVLKDEISRLMPKWEEITGLYCSEWQIKNMKTRWGTCNVATKKIWLNLQLAKKAPDCLEYVILHELAHLKEKGHGEKFKAIMTEYMPQWKEIKKMLNNLD